MLALAEQVVSVCRDADEHCPVLPGGTHKLHGPLDDPVRAVGSEAELMRVFRAIRATRMPDEPFNIVQPARRSTDRIQAPALIIV
jgi:hypothetical protein